ncbi:hypothetical protein H696_02813 [Fonticula alba]|uniref:Clathrin/coatomer adaptor adaptin-like N-terminal domain-containing protein n=1 Tax=Fonticula alba TaxID=691883 RepID=A0A058ZAM0_FONAL|nr:hypothetical protein H696_02813 [Fonticula alba]KCV70472.1 hypothetical protein H696_02813 [Fonticula alba]|eukprot:XP_009494988.1 hypothetical protein H696_02813 [Fonticula alba]
MSTTLRGLNIYITDIRACRSREEEERRVNRELVNIRNKFKDASKMSSYDRKKYALKLLYTYILGWDVDFGHMECMQLITSNKFQEKQIGYLAVTLLLSEKSELVHMVVNSIRNDLTSSNETYVCLALAAVSNVGGLEMAEALHKDVFALLVAQNTRLSVRKRAAICLLRLYNKNKDVMAAAEWAPQLGELLSIRFLLLSNALLSLLLCLAQDHPVEYQSVMIRVVEILGHLLPTAARKAAQKASSAALDTEYYRVPNPWLQVKCLRMLQLARAPLPEAQLAEVERMIGDILQRGQFALAHSKSANQLNASQACVLEAINLTLHFNFGGELLHRSVAHLGSLIGQSQPNMKYLGLEGMANVALVLDDLSMVEPFTRAITSALRDRDITIRRCALDLLYFMCNDTTSRTIVPDLLEYLNIADYALREELVLKIAILAERFAADHSWYVDVILQLIQYAGDHVSESIWHRVVQIVSTEPDFQPEATYKVLQSLNKPSWHETTVKIGGYLLGEYGELIASRPDAHPQIQFNSLQSKFGACSTSTKALLLSSYVKMASIFPELQPDITAIFEYHADALDMELQQRSVEYLELVRRAAQGDPAYQELLEIMCEPMPAWDLSKLNESDPSGRRESTLLDSDAGFGAGGLASPAGTGMLSSPVSATTIAQRRSTIRRTTLSGTIAAALNATTGGSPASPMLPTPVPLAGHGSGSPVVPAAAGPAGSSPGPAATGGAATSSHRQSPVVDLLDLDFGQSSALGTGPGAIQLSAPPAGTGVAATAATVAQVGFSEFGQLGQPTAAAESAFGRLLGQQQGVLFEDDLLRVGLKVEFHGSRGRLRLFFANQQASPGAGRGPASALAIRALVEPDFLVQSIGTSVSSRGLSVEVHQPLPGVVEQQDQLVLLCQCERPDFATAPTLLLAYAPCAVAGGAAAPLLAPMRRVLLRLPIGLTCFPSPLPANSMSSEVFWGRWASLLAAGTANEATASFSVGQGLTPEALRALIGQMGFSLMAGVEQAADNTAAAIIVSFAQTAPGSPAATPMSTGGAAAGVGAKVGVLLRVEFNRLGHSVALHVRSPNPLVSRTVMGLLQRRILSS